jgi:hypothetical protein
MKEAKKKRKIAKHFQKSSQKAIEKGGAPSDPAFWKGRN